MLLVQPSTASATNHLAGEKSPYLLQHADNPVDWYPWGEEALTKARTEHKPIFLSIGYSTCHWCHVMAAESFSDPTIAALLNEHFVAIKIDREERPDLDRIYQAFVQASTGSGGWPLSVWLTPEGNPFFGGTYFPPMPQDRLPGFKSLLAGLARAWTDQSDRIRDQSTQMLASLAAELSPTAATESLPWSALRHSALVALRDRFDTTYGGFDAEAKFPAPVNLELLLDLAGSATTPTADRVLARQLATDTLRAITNGGLTDHVGGGFHRYTVDRAWRVPHFEKMLYDQAQVTSVLLSAWQLTGEGSFRDAATAALTYVRAQLTSPEGGFTSAEDADSATADDPTAHREGAFYTWTTAELDAALPDPDERDLVRRAFAITDRGNVAPDADSPHERIGPIVLALAPDFAPTPTESNRFHVALQHLAEVRAERPRPHLDDKIITAWNGLMISAFARAAQIFNEPTYLVTAQRAATFLHTLLYNETTGDLARSYRSGRRDAHGFPEDYACLVQALLDLYETDLDPAWLQWALRLQERQDALFWDSDHGGYLASPATDTSVVLRLQAEQDGAEPTATSVAVRNLGRLSALFHRTEFLARARAAARSLAVRAQQNPLALPQLLASTGWLDGDAQQALIHGASNDPGTDALLRIVRSHYHPRRVVLAIDATSRPFFETQVPFVAGLPDGVPAVATAYICENFVCQLPVTAPAALATLLDRHL